VSEPERFKKTIKKTRLGGLPAPTREAANFLPGNGKACDGCADIISTDETLYCVTVHGAVHLRFHHECYLAWSQYERSAIDLRMHTH
jgi:hypothetical protein